MRLDISNAKLVKLTSASGRTYTGLLAGDWFVVSGAQQFALIPSKHIVQECPDDPDLRYSIAESLYAAERHRAERMEREEAQRQADNEHVEFLRTCVEPAREEQLSLLEEHPYAVCRQSRGFGAGRLPRLCRVDGWEKGELWGRMYNRKTKSWANRRTNLCDYLGWVDEAGFRIWDENPKISLAMVMTPRPAVLPVSNLPESEEEN